MAAVDIGHLHRRPKTDKASPEKRGWAAPGGRERGRTARRQENYPPFDLVRLDDNRFRISLAVAGFGQGEIDITAQQNQLVVTGKKADDDGSSYIHRGIANRSFERRFGLADHITVSGADLKDGLLSIDLVREIPEAMKPRKIEIGGETPRHDAIEATANKTVDA